MRCPNAATEPCAYPECQCHAAKPAAVWPGWADALADGASLKTESAWLQGAKAARACLPAKSCPYPATEPAGLRQRIELQLDRQGWLRGHGWAARQIAEERQAGEKAAQAVWDFLCASDSEGGEAS